MIEVDTGDEDAERFLLAAFEGEMLVLFFLFETSFAAAAEVARFAVAFAAAAAVSDGLAFVFVYRFALFAMSNAFM